MQKGLKRTTGQPLRMAAPVSWVRQAWRVAFKQRCFNCCGGSWMIWRCKSSTGPARGTVSRTARVPTARWDLKEAAGKALARRTEIAYEAAVAGEKAHIFKARYLHGSCGRKCGGHKCEGHTSYPGRSVNLPCATDIERCWDGLAEVSSGHICRANRSMKGQSCHWK